MPSLSADQTLMYNTTIESVGQQNNKKARRKKKKAAINDIVETVSAMFSSLDVQDAVKHLKDKQLAITTDNLIDTVYYIKGQKEQGQYISSPGESNQFRESKTHTDSSDIDGSLSSTESEDDQTLPSETKYTKEWYEKQIQTLRTMCQYCYKARASILLLPCAHVSCCKDCLPLIRRCPVSTCKKIVRGTKEIFFV